MATQDSRIKIKRSTVTATVPTVPSSNDHTDGTWIATDIYKGELFYNQADNCLWTRSDNGVECLVCSTGWQSFTNQDLNSNPVDIVGLEARGAGIAVIPVGIDFAIDAGVTAYDFPVKGIELVYNGFTDTIANVTQSLINSGTDAYGTFKVQDSTAIKTNTKMQLYASADATQGTGTYYVKTYYKIVTMPF